MSDSLRASTAMTIDELDAEIEQKPRSPESSQSRPSTAKKARHPKVATIPLLQTPAKRPDSAVLSNSGLDALPQMDEHWCKLKLRHPKRFERDAFDRFLQRQDAQIQRRQKSASSYANMTSVERLIARGLLDRTSASTRLLSPGKDNTPSFTEFLSRQDAAAKNRFARSRQGPTPSNPIRPKVKQQLEGDFESFLARQAAAEARLESARSVCIPAWSMGWSIE